MALLINVEQHNHLPLQTNNKALIELHRGPAYYSQYLKQFISGYITFVFRLHFLKHCLTLRNAKRESLQRVPFN